MKKFLPGALVAVLAVALYTSCTKNEHYENGSYICKCTLKSKTTGQDSLIGTTTYGGIFSHDKAAVQCTKYGASIEYKYPGVTCSVD